MANSLGIVKKSRPGDDIDAYCGKCKEVRTHAIVALSSQGGVDRVQCRTCQGNHKYKPAASAGAEGSRKSGSTRTRAAAGTRETRGRRSAEAAAADLTPAKDYSMRERFRVGDRIAHPRFGLGLVIDERSGKIDVRFGKEVRTLVHSI
jgi:hypothetical protein